jgi:hypothetical protein
VWQWPEISKWDKAEAWGLFSFGLVIGSTFELTGNMEWNSCLTDISVILLDGYSVYVFIRENIKTSESTYAIYASAYAIECFEKVINIRCGKA